MTAANRRRIVAAVLAVAAVVALFLAFSDDDTGAASSSAAAPATVTPLWSVRRVPEPVAEAVGAQHLQTALDTAAPGDGTCFVVRAGNRVLAAHDPDTPLIGASTQKVFVAAAALTTLGPDFTYQTKVMAPAAPADGSVDRLYLVGAGDPVLATNDYASFLQANGKSHGDVTTSLESLADAIVAKGVKSVPGGIIGDDSRYDDQRYLPSWKDTYRTDGEVGPLDALTVNDGFSAWSVGQNTPVADPALNAASHLADLLRARGVNVGSSSHGTAPAGAVEITSISSPPLRDIVASMLRSSDNLTAELLTKELAVHAGTTPGTTAAGVKATTAKLKTLGVPVPDGALLDGSGLDRGNRITCDLLVATLALTDRPELSTLFDGLPVAGQSGTLFDQFLGTSLVGRFHGKTGSLDGVSGLTGEMDVGQTLRFAFLENGDFSDAQASVIRSRIGGIVGQFPNAPAVDALVPKPQ